MPSLGQPYRQPDPVNGHEPAPDRWLTLGQACRVLNVDESTLRRWADAGQVRTFINAAENEKYNRKRGYTEFISVRRPWRKRGLARALIVRSLRLQKECGMTESALGADSENISGATRIYEDCGFRITKRNTLYRKPINLVPQGSQFRPSDHGDPVL